MFELERYLSLGVDAAIYFVLAGIATLLFLAKLALDMVFGGTGSVPTRPARCGTQAELSRARRADWQWGSAGARNAD